MHTKSQKAFSWGGLLDIFVTFCKIGPVTFGGGYAMIPQIERESVLLHRWLSEKEVIDLLAISGAAPGAIGINAAFSIGYRVAGLRGAFAAFLGVVLPTFLIVILLTTTYSLYKDNPRVAAAFEGIRASIAALIIYAATRMARSAIIDKSTAVQAAIFLIALSASWISPVWAMAAGPFVGLVVTHIKRKTGVKIPAEIEVKKQPVYVHSDYFIGDGI